MFQARPILPIVVGQESDIEFIGVYGNTDIKSHR